MCTVPDFDCAQKIAQMLVEKRLAACCNIIPGLTSIYSWEDKIQQDSELLLVIKSVEQNFSPLEKAIKQLHPYDVPEIISVNISMGSKKYLDWIFSLVKGKNEN